MLAKVLELHVNGIVQVNGGVVYKNQPMITDIRGRLPAKEGAVDNRKMFMVPSGSYVILFDEACPGDFSDDPNCLYILDQYDLMYAGMKLTLSPDKFIGYLEVTYASQIEVGAKLATLKYKNMEHTYEATSESEVK
jgi:hypothetical protein